MKHRIKKYLKEGRRVKKYCRKHYPDWVDNEYNCGFLKFIWGMTQNPDVEKEASFCTLNKAIFYYNRYYKRYYLDISLEDCQSEEEIKTSTHEGEEFIYVLEGQVEIIYGKDKYLLEKGDSIYYESIVAHHVHSYGENNAKILAVVYTPA